MHRGLISLLTTLAIVSASEQNTTRSTRDISFIKDFFFSKLFGSEEENQTAVPHKLLIRHPVSLRLFQIPSQLEVAKNDKITEKDLVNILETPSYIEHPSIAVVSSYLGTKTLNETLDALKGVNTLLQSGVLNAKHNEVSNIAKVSFNHAKPTLMPPVYLKSGKVTLEIEDMTFDQYAKRYPHLLNDIMPIPLQPHGQVYPVKEYIHKGVNIQNLPISTQYSYKQVNHDGVRSYNSNDNRNVIVTESENPVPLPPYIGHRFEEILALGVKPMLPAKSHHLVPSININKPSIPAQVFGVPKIPLNVYKPVKLSPPPSSYSYQHLHNDGTVTKFLGNGFVEENIVDKSVVHEKPRPFHNTYIDGFYKESFSATANKLPSPPVIKETFYTPGLIYQEPYPIVVERFPEYVPISSNHIKQEHNLEHNFEHHTAHKVPAGYSYQLVHNNGPVSVHQDFSSGLVKTNSLSKVEHLKHQQASFNGSMVHNKPMPSSSSSYNYVNNRHQNNSSNKVKIVCKDNSHTGHTMHEHNVIHAKPVSGAKNGGYSYTTVHKDGAVTNYLGTGHILETSHINVAQPVVYPSAVREKIKVKQGENFLLPKPLVSQYVYKQINHQNPDIFTVVNLDDVQHANLDGQVNVQVGPRDPPVHITPYPYRPLTSSTSHPKDTSQLPNKDAFPERTTDVASTMEINSGKKFSHLFTQLSSQGVYTNKDGSADFVSHQQSSSSVPTVSEGTVSTSIPSTESTTFYDNSLSANPIVVLPQEETYSYKQNKADGSTVKVSGSFNNVSVIEESVDNSAPHRGDIPETFV